MNIYILFIFLNSKVVAPVVEWLRVPSEICLIILVDYNLKMKSLLVISNINTALYMYLTVCSTKN